MLLTEGFFPILSTIVQMPCSEGYDSQMTIHTLTSNIYISLARESQTHVSDPTLAHGLLCHVKDRKRAVKWKCNEIEYHAQYIKYVSHITIKIPCAKTQLPAL